MKFQSHVPNFVDCDPAIPMGEFESIEKLLEHPWIKDWNYGQDGFHYCWSDNNGQWSNAVLMAEWLDETKKRTWWVLGYLDEIPALPKWEHKKGAE